MEIEVVIDPATPEISLKKILGLSVVVRTVMAAIAAGCRRVVIVTQDPAVFEQALKGISIPLILVSKRPDPKQGRIFFSGDTHYDPDLIRQRVAVPSPSWGEGEPALSEVEGGEGERNRAEMMFQLSQKLDNPESFKLAERKLFENIRRKTEGWVAPHINKPISFFITKYLVRTKITPNQITLINLLVAVAAFFFLIRADYVTRIVGALLMYLSSIIDGCDGEVARLKLMTSKAGAWFDTIADDISNNLFLAAVALGLYGSTGGNNYLIFGLASVLMSLGATAVIYHQLLTRLSTGNAKDFTPAWKGEQKKRWSDKIRPLLKRDFFIAVIFVFVVLDLREIVFWMGLAATGITFILYSYSLILSLKKANSPHVPS